MVLDIFPPSLTWWHAFVHSPYLTLDLVLIPVSIPNPIPFKLQLQLCPILGWKKYHERLLVFYYEASPMTVTTTTLDHIVPRPLAAALSTSAPLLPIRFR